MPSGVSCWNAWCPYWPKNSSGVGAMLTLLRFTELVANRLPNLLAWGPPNDGNHHAN